MLHVWFRLFILMAALSVAGCGRGAHHDEPSYLAQHPAKLRSEVEYCQNAMPGSLASEGATAPAANEAYCRSVQQVADKVFPYMTSSQEDPEQFGQQILDKEMKVAKARESWEKAQLQQEVEMMLAVVGLNRPE